MKSEYGIEYLIYGAHYDELDAPVPERFYFGRDILAPHDLERYEQNIIPGIESKFYTYVAHPDSSAVTLILMNTVLHSVIVFVKLRLAAMQFSNITSPVFFSRWNIIGWIVSLIPISGALPKIMALPQLLASTPTIRR